MVCPSCNKFCAFEAQEPEADGLDIEGTTVTGSVRLVLNSECCSEEMKEANFDVDLDLQDQIVDAIIAERVAVAQEELDNAKSGADAASIEAAEAKLEAAKTLADFDEDKLADVEITDSSAEAEDRYENKDRHGKPIKSARYMKHMYGARVSVSVKGTYDGTEFEVNDAEWFDEVASSGMDELV
jgi:hypothetical protein